MTDIIPLVRYAECPLCGHRDFPFLRSADCTHHPGYRPGLPPLIRWHRCAACEHVFTDGYFGADALELLFQATHDRQRVGGDLERQRIAFGPDLRANGQALTPPGRWLDVGFGNGSLVFTAAEFGYTAVGLDLRQENVSALKGAGFEAHLASIEDYAGPADFSVVSMCDVLEHMPYPKIGLATARRLLEPGGT